VNFSVVGRKNVYYCTAIYHEGRVALLLCYTEWYSTIFKDVTIQINVPFLLLTSSVTLHNEPNTSIVVPNRESLKMLCTTVYISSQIFVMRIGRNATM
jgi:hypothetical protein